MEEGNRMFRILNMRINIVRQLFEKFYNETTMDQQLTDDQDRIFKILIDKWETPMEDTNFEHYMEMANLHSKLTNVLMKDPNWERYVIEHIKLRVNIMEFNQHSVKHNIIPI